MCSLFSQDIDLSDIEVAFDVFNLFATHSTYRKHPQIFPNQKANVIAKNIDGGICLTEMIWGFPPPKGAPPSKVIFNTRNLNSYFWKERLRKPKYRCLVPVTRFCEYDGAKQQRWFGLDRDPSLFAFAGIWRPMEDEEAKGKIINQRFSFLTTEPNDLIKPIHPKAMPVCLSLDADYETWMNADWDTAKQLVEPYSGNHNQGVMVEFR